MGIGIVGKKLGMTQIFDEEGNLIPVTVIKAGPCTVVQKKTIENDGYEALQLGFEEIKKIKKVNKPMMGHFKKHNVSPFKILKEIRNVDDFDNIKVGDIITVEKFSKGDKVKVTGKSKGRGFTGTVKRFGTRRGPESHGSRYHRRPGSRGQCADPSRVFKGVVTPGRYGGETVTVKNLEVVDLDVEKNIILLKGAVPGHIKSYVLIYKN